MAKRLPWFKFFAADWLAEPTLRVVSLAARGLAIDMLCVMDQSPRRGFLLSASGDKLPVEHLARVVGADAVIVEGLIQELLTAVAFSSDSTGVIYSRRMVDDTNLREKRGAAGSLGGFAKAKSCQTASKSLANTLAPSISPSHSSSLPLTKPEHGPTRDSAPIPRPGSMPPEPTPEEMAAEADTAFGGDGDIPPEPNALMLAVGRYCDSVGIGNESTRYRIYQDCESWAGPEAFGPQIVAEGLRWGIEQSKPWKVVASHIRSKAETSGWVDKKAKDKPAGRSKAVERFMAGGDA